MTENVTAWADAFGIWHARVPSGRGAYRKARRAIWQAVNERQGDVWPLASVRIAKVCDDGECVEYKEKDLLPDPMARRCAEVGPECELCQRPITDSDARFSIGQRGNITHDQCAEVC